MNLPPLRFSGRGGGEAAATHFPPAAENANYGHSASRARNFFISGFDYTLFISLINSS